MNSKAFARLYDDFYPRVFRYLIGRLHDTRGAEDLAAEVFVVALKALQKGTQPRQVGSWLVGIADHLASQYWRKKQREETPAGSLVVEEADPEAIAVGRIENEELWRCVNALSPDHRQVLLLRIVAGLSSREAAEVMGKTEVAVRSIQVRALAALRQQWTEAGSGGGTDKPVQ